MLEDDIGMIEIIIVIIILFQNLFHPFFERSPNSIIKDLFHMREFYCVSIMHAF